MRQTKTNLMVEQKPLGVIDVLTAGFEIVRKRPWTILIPMLFDLAIWVLPRISLASLFRPSLDQVFDTRGLPPEAVTSVEQTREAVSQFIGSLHLLGVVTATLDFIAQMPSLLTLNN